MIDDSKRKGFASILMISVLVLISSGIVFYFLNYSPPKEHITGNREQPKSLPSESLPTKSSTQVIEFPKFVESDIDITKIPTDGRLYLALNLPDESTKNRINVFTKVPESSQVVYSLTRENDLDIKMKVNEAEYNIKVLLGGGTGGVCLRKIFNGQCGYIDEQIQTLSSVKIEAFRIWSGEKGILYLNPIWIYKDTFYINHIEIYKLKPDTVFKEQEVNMWRDILKSISFEKVS